MRCGAAPPRCFARNGTGGFGAERTRSGSGHPGEFLPGTIVASGAQPGGGVSPKGRTRPVLSPVGGRARFGSVCCRRGGGRPPGAGRSVAEVPCPVLGR